MNPILISSIASLIAQLGPLGLELFLKLETMLNLSPDEKANIANAIAAADSANAETIANVNAWMAANGFTAKTVFVQKAQA